MCKVKWWEWAAVGLFLVVGVWLRGAQVESGSLDTDELLTLIHSRRPVVESVYSLQDLQPPLYPLMARVGRLFWSGEGSYPPEWFLRGPAVVAGCLLVVGAWWYGRSLFGPIVGVLAAGAVSMNALLVFYSREARPYSLFALMAVLSMGFFYQLVRGGKRRDLIGYAVTTPLMFYSHYYAVFCVAGQLAYLTGDLIFGRSARGNFKAVFFGLFLGGLGSVPAALLLGRIAQLGLAGTWWIRKPWLSDVVDSLGDLIGVRAAGALCLFPLLAAFWPGETFFDRPPRNPRNPRKGTEPDKSDGGGSLEMSEESDAGVAGKPDNWWVRRDAAIFSALWVAFGLWLPLAASMVWKIGFLARYALPVAVPLTAVGIYYLRKRHVVLLTGVLLVVVGWNVPKAVRHQNAQEGVRELVGRLKSHAEAGEPIVVVNWAAYTADFHSPELEGMKYYGFDVAGRGVQSVGVERLSGKIVLDSSQVLPLSRAWVVCYAEASGPLRQFLADRERAYQVTRFGTVELYQLSSDRQWTEGS